MKMEHFHWHILTGLVLMQNSYFVEDFLLAVSKLKENRYSDHI